MVQPANDWMCNNVSEPLDLARVLSWFGLETIIFARGRAGSNRAVLTTAGWSAHGTQQARAYAAVCPVLAEADIRPLNGNSRFDPNRTRTALPAAGVSSNRLGYPLTGSL
jgi:hypothetical protein